VAIDLTETFRFLNEFLPYFAKQKMQLDQQRKLMELYLNKQLAEYGAWEETQKRGRAEQYDYDTKIRLLASLLKGTEKLDRPAMAGLMRAPELGMDFGLPEVSPEQYGEAVRPYTKMMADQAGALEAGEYLPVEKMGVATQLKGSEYAMDLLKEIEKTRAGREERGLRKGELDLARAEAGVKGEKLTKKQLEENLKYWAKKEKIFVDELESMEKEMGLMEDDPKYDAKSRQVDEARQIQLNTCDQILGELDKKKCDKIIAKLSAGKATVKGLEKNKEKFMKKENLTEAEYNYIRLNL